MKALLLISMMAFLPGCFYPPQQPPLAPNRAAVTLDLPYDLAWDALHTVVVQDALHIVTENPDAGALEAQAVGGFTLADADCGQLRGIAGKIAAEPDPDASIVYDFQVKASEPHTSVVSVNATFTAPLHVPLHQPSDEQCVSRGVQEARLLKQIKEQALLEHHPGTPPPKSGIVRDAPSR
ncbi:MAG: hypothetical protein ACREQD_04355 [Candidatus Binataceae bacterium]